MSGKTIPHGEQLLVLDGQQRVTVNFYPKRAAMVVGGVDSPLKEAIQAWVNGSASPPMKESPASGVEPTPPARSSSVQPAVPQAKVVGAHIGLDESGKGDWFGPLVVAAVYVDASTEEKLHHMGVRDSKTLAPSTVQQLAGAIERLIPERARYVRMIDPVEYNQLYQRHGNINLLLAEAYAQTARHVEHSSPTETIVCDQFSQRADRLTESFAQVGLSEPVQMHHAEAASIAVAAASILASATFASALTELGREAALEGPLPKGASDLAMLERAARHIIELQGPPALGRYAKLNFKPVAALLANAGADSLNDTKPVAEARRGHLVRIEQPAWQLMYQEQAGLWRFTFADGGILDWYAQHNGKLDVRGNAGADSYQQLRQTADGKIFSPGNTPLDTKRQLERLKSRIGERFPKYSVAVPSVLDVGWRQKDTVLGVRWEFTDGGLLQYYRGTDKLLIQGRPSAATLEVLMALKSPFWPGLDVLIDKLRLLFPDWQLGQRVSPDDDRLGQVDREEMWQSIADSLGWQNLWPPDRELRHAANSRAPSQRALLDDWASVLAHHQGMRHLLAHAPTGLGKTAAALVPALAWIAEHPDRRRVYYLVNRVAQHDNPIRELRAGLADRFEARTGQRLHVVDMVSRQLLCSSPATSPLAELCRRSRENASFDLLPDGIASGWDVRAHLGDSRCTYHTLQGLMGRAHVVICDYWWLFSQQAQTQGFAERAGVSVTDTILIVDEAHNLPLRVRAQFDIDAPTAQLSEQIQQFPPQAQSCLVPVLAEVRRASPDHGIAPSTLLPIAGGRDAVQAALSEIGADKPADEPVSAAEGMLHLLLLPDPDVVIYPEPAARGGERAVFRLIDPTPMLRRGYACIHASLSMSGTLAAPADSSDELRYQVPIFGLPLNETLTRKYASPFSLRNQQWSYSPDTYGTYSQRARYLPRYAEHVVAIGQATAGGVTAVFFSSYGFLQEVLDAVGPSERQLITAEQPVGADGRDEVGWTPQDYEQRLRELVVEHGRAYLFAVYQGKLAEGASFADNLIRSVVCISIPLEYPGLFHQRLQARYQDLFASVAQERGDPVESKAIEYARDRQSLSLVLQACGRGIRSPSDRCAFVLLDRRYEEYGWRRFLEPRPYNLRQPGSTIERFLTEQLAGVSADWDSVLLRACRREKM